MNNRFEIATTYAARLYFRILAGLRIHDFIAVALYRFHAQTTTVHSDVHRTCGADRCSPFCLFLRHFLPARREPLCVGDEEIKNFFPVDRCSGSYTSLALRHLSLWIHTLTYPIFYFLSQGGEWRIYCWVVHVGAVLGHSAQKLFKRNAFHPIAGLRLLVNPPTASTGRGDS
jgi:hypothetical protein